MANAKAKSCAVVHTWVFIISDGPIPTNQEDVRGASGRNRRRAVRGELDPNGQVVTGRVGRIVFFLGLLPAAVGRMAGVILTAREIEPVQGLAARIVADCAAAPGVRASPAR